MALRKGHCYTPRKRAYTRKSRLRSKNYVKAGPPSKISKFIMGDSPSYFAGKFDLMISFLTCQEIQLRDNSLEAARQLILRHLNNDVKTFCFFLHKYPHHILRENKMLTGAGADRMQSGMKHCFGKPVNLAAQVKAGEKIFSVACNLDKAKDVHRILDMAKPKLPKKYTIVEEKLK